jgi:endonuclease-3 related protein
MPRSKVRRSPLKAYKLLLKFFGPQGWWPTTSKKAVKPQYHPCSYLRNTEKEKFEVLIGAILTQNTSWKNVEKALIKLNAAGLVSASKIAGLNLKKLARAVRSSGYYNQKAKKLKGIAIYLQKRYKGKLEPLFNKDLQEMRRELLALNGIGPETADSIILYAAARPVFVVDAYTKRIGHRLGWYKDAAYDEMQRFFESSVPKSLEIYNEYHALLVALGKDYCRAKKPLCVKCPLKNMCKYALPALRAGK